MADKHGLIFAGQAYSPKYVDGYYKNKRPNWKSITHETQQQPTFQPTEYVDVVHNSQKYAILYNGVDNALLLPYADYFLLRRNLYNAFASYHKYLKILGETFNQPTLDHNRLMWDFNLRFNCVYNICLYSMRFQKPITWYEDHYNTPDYEPDEEILKYFRIVGQTNLDTLFVEAGGSPFTHLL